MAYNLYLVRCNALVEKKQNKRCSEIWVSNGDIDFELKLPLELLDLLGDEMLHDLFSEMIFEYSNDEVRYTYRSYEVIYNRPIRVKYRFQQKISNKMELLSSKVSKNNFKK